MANGGYRLIVQWYHRQNSAQKPKVETQHNVGTVIRIKGKASLQESLGGKAG